MTTVAEEILASRRRISSTNEEPRLMINRPIKNLSYWGLLALLTLSPLPNLLRAQSKAANKKQESSAPMKLKVGDMAPDFTLLAFDGKDLKRVSLRDYQGKKNVALAFYVFAFTGG
jgi:hypothetical protein